MHPWLRLLLLCLLGTLGAAHAVTPRFDVIGDADSLRDNIVTSLTRDRQGLLWLGTANGLVRYDGHELRRFGVPAASGESASEQFVRCVLADPRGPIWVGMGSTGLARWEPDTGRWTRWLRVNGESPGAEGAAPLSGALRALAFTPDGALWVGSSGGLDRFDPLTGRFHHFQAAAGGLPDKRVQSLLADTLGRLWIGTSKGLARRDGERVLLMALPGATSPSITLLAMDDAGHVLVGSSQGGLWWFPVSGGGAEIIEAEGQGVGAGSYFALAQPDAQEIWLGGAAALERRRASDLSLIERLSTDGGSSRPAPRSEVRALLRDASGIVWVGTYAHGLMRHLPPRPGLTVHRPDPASWFKHGDWDVRSILQRRNGEVWLGTQSQGIEILDGQLGAADAIRPVARSQVQGLPPGRVASLAETADGSVWAAVDNRLVRFDAQGRWRETLPAVPATLRRLHVDHGGNLWAASNDGLWRWAPDDHELKPYALDTPLVELNTFAETTDGTLWLGGVGGLYRRGPSPDAHFERIEPQGMEGQSVVGLAADGERGLWIDTIAGLHRLVSVDGRRARIERVLAPSSEDAEASFGANLLVDAQGRVWTHRGVYDPKTRTHNALGPSDGVDFGTGWFRSYAAMMDGRLLFGGSQGLLAVQPAAFKPWDYAPPLALTALRVAGRERPVPASGSRVELAPGETAVTLGFAALDYSQPGRTRYRYRLVGLDEAWVEVDATARLASYTNLAPKLYRFEVQGSNRNGDWSPQRFSLELHVQPQWWQTWWARVLTLAASAAMLLCAARAWMRWRTRRLRQRQRELEARVHERTQALEAATEQLAEKSRLLEAISLTDPLTGMHNRRFLEQHLPADVALTVRRHEDRPPQSPQPAGEDLVFFLVDVDHFKRVNDSHGHAAGDQVLQLMRERLEQVLRASDYSVRWGGEEFLFVARGLPRSEAAELAQRACAAVASRPFELGDGLSLNVTCSIGFAAFPPAPQWPRALSWSRTVDLADAALYEAKHTGRNRWVGVLHAHASSEAQLSQDAADGLAAWQASGRLKLLRQGE